MLVNKIYFATFLMIYSLNDDNSKIEKYTHICQFNFSGLRKSYTDVTAQTLAVARTLRVCKQIGMFNLMMEMLVFFSDPSKIITNIVVYLF